MCGGRVDDGSRSSSSSKAWSGSSPCARANRLLFLAKWRLGGVTGGKTFAPSDVEAVSSHGGSDDVSSAPVLDIRICELDDDVGESPGPCRSGRTNGINGHQLLIGVDIFGGFMQWSPSSEELAMALRTYFRT